MSPLVQTPIEPESDGTRVTERKIQQIELRGVRVHNLKNFDLDIPLRRLVVISGVSGSGKSSLAFDTLFAEGQRRYVESFSVAARRHLEQIERPDADRISHVPVTIAIRGDNANLNRVNLRSTVASVGELMDGLRLLYARVGRIICPGCGREIRAHRAEDVAQAFDALPVGTRCQIGFTIDGRAERDSAANWLARGFSRAIWDEKTQDLGTLAAWPETSEIEIVSDRLISGQASAERVMESANAALRDGSGRCWLMVPSTESTAPDARSVDGRYWQMLRFDRRLKCAACQREFLPLDSRLLSHFSTGACLQCRGTGRDNLDQLGSADCPACEGTRLREEARAVQVANRSLPDVLRQIPSFMLTFLQSLNEIFTDSEKDQTELVRAEIERRLRAVCELGLDYLPLDRSASTLSGGEFRRLKLAAAIGSRITGTLVVVDEPSSGLTVDEIPHVVAALRKLLAIGNSVIAVDHAPGIVSAADDVIELGPGAGPAGGSIVYRGPPRSHTEEKTDEASVSQPTSSSAPQKVTDVLRLASVCHRNLRDRNFEFPMGQICVITGPSGSGKTSLVAHVLYPALCRRLELPCDVVPSGTCELSGGCGIVDVVLVDQSPLAKSSRSNPATWLGVFDEIRQTFATTADAKQRGFTSRQFSFNSSSGGRCRSCLGTGLLKQDMQFLPEITLPCPECEGHRYRPEILEVKYRGRSIADVLAMSVSEAAVFFRSQPRIQNRFQFVKQIGLDYLVLGQPSETLSGGEAQRLKLAAKMASPFRGMSLLICDEPTSGLHPDDVRRLVSCFRDLVANGHSIVLADNSPELVAAADCVIPLRSGKTGL